MKRITSTLPCLAAVGLAAISALLGGCDNSTSKGSNAATTPTNTIAAAPKAAPEANNPRVPSQAQGYAQKLGYRTDNARR
jgi:hypothetical protein